MPPPLSEKPGLGGRPSFRLGSITDPPLPPCQAGLCGWLLRGVRRQAGGGALAQHEHFWGPGKQPGEQWAGEG